MGTLELPSEGKIYLDANCFISLFVTNDNAFRRVSDLKVIVLSEIIDQVKSTTNENESQGNQLV